MRITIKSLLIIGLLFLGIEGLKAQELVDELAEQTTYTVLLKKPGNPSELHQLKVGSNGSLQADQEIPLNISRQIKTGNAGATMTITIEAVADAYFSFQGQFTTQDLNYDTSYLFLPGFWYRKNLRSPDSAPSARVSKDWIVREDRLSTPLVGVFDRQQGVSYSLARMDKIEAHSLTQHQQGEVVLSGHSDIGAVGFGEENGVPDLTFAYPYKEAPHRYYRKLTLGDPVTALIHLKKGESVTLNYLLMKFEADDYADYMEQIWTRSYDLFQPKPLASNKFTDDEIKTTLTKFYSQSFVDAGNLKGFSGIHLKTHVCEVRKILEVGFIGRVLLNAYNALEYAEGHKDKPLEEMAYAVMDSYEKHGFAENGFFREVVNMENDTELTTYSIRRQSEGIYAILLYLDYEKRHGRQHPVWEKKIQNLLDIILELQQEDGSYPRKFKGDLALVDPTGGSSPSAVLPLAMAYKYFGEKKYLNSARDVVDYLEEINSN